MKITGIISESVVMPKTDKEWKFALGGGGESKGALVRIQADGDAVEGIGYTSSMLHYGVTQGALLETIYFLGEVLAGCDPMSIEANRERMDRAIAGSHQAKAGIEIALHDLVGKVLDVPVYQLLGGLTREEISVIRILALKAPDVMADIAAGHVAEGYKYLKIKVGGDVATDIERVEAIRSTVGRDVGLTVDANQSYSVREAIKFVRNIERYDIDLVEQPVHRDDIEGLGEVRHGSLIPIEADESAYSIERVGELISRRAVDRISIKLAKLGGLQNALSVARMCKAMKIGCRMGAAVGSRVLNAACMHFVAAVPNIDYACELGEYHRLENDPAEGLDVRDGKLRVPIGPGLGVGLTDNR